MRSSCTPPLFCRGSLSCQRESQRSPRIHPYAGGVSLKGRNPAASFLPARAGGPWRKGSQLSFFGAGARRTTPCCAHHMNLASGRNTPIKNQIVLPMSISQPNSLMPSELHSGANHETKKKEASVPSSRSAPFQRTTHTQNSVWTEYAPIQPISDMTFLSMSTFRCRTLLPHRRL